MRKLLSFVISFLVTVNALASESVTLPTPWGSGCTVSSGTYTFDGKWSGAGTWIGGIDKSAYDYVYIKFAKATGNVAFSVSYNEVQSVESWGNKYYSTSAVISETSKESIVGLKLDKDSKLTSDASKNYSQDVLQISLQDHGTASSLEIEGIYFATSTEYQKALDDLNRGDAENGNPSDTLWSGDKTIDWNNSSWYTIAASSFNSAKTGMKLRFGINDVVSGAQGHICTSSWKDMPDATAYIQLSGAYFEYTITDDMLTELKTNGCIVTGVGFKLSAVMLIDESKIPNMTCSLVSDDIKAWEQGEKPILRVSLTNKQSTDVTTTASLSLRTDHYVSVTQVNQTAKIAAGATDTIMFDLSSCMTIPGFYHATVCANYAQIADYNLGYDPAHIVSPVDSQNDFTDFWNQAKSDLAKVKPEFTLTKIEKKSTSNRNVFLVEMKSIDNGDGAPVTVRGYYAEPVASGKYPVLITQNGYDSDTTSAPYCPNADSNTGWIDFVFSVRGQSINNRAPYKADNIYGDWFVYNFGNKDKYYYRGAYMDVLRSIDFIMSRDKVDTLNVFMAGSSQGGALTIAGAALDTRLNAIAPSIQFMGDFPDYFQVGSWPAYPAHQKQKELGLSDDDMYKFLSYFDTKNLAPYITCPVITAMGLQDPVCPPHTNFAPYNNISVSDKHYVVNSFCKHEVPATWYNTYMTFFNNHMKTATPVKGVNVTDSNDEKIVYDISGEVISKGKNTNIPSGKNGILIILRKGVATKVIK